MKPYSQKDSEIEYSDTRDTELRNMEEEAFAEHFRPSQEDYQRVGE